ncbi:MAG: NAD(P)-dependent glycerol-3-phosphate dehydrogenase [Candidatus Omnitrophica bacterium]|nr:NAD(P)-dependent glycerol-3-phosphate dehydrogenase [Candidatus Omnitrophota bacterium]
MKKKIAVIGDGGWGTTVAILLCNKGYDVTIWGAFPGYVALLKKERVNSKFLPDVQIPKEINLISSLADIEKMPGETIFVIATPSKYLRGTLGKFKGKIKSEKIVSLTKGIEIETLKRPSSLISEVLGKKKVAALSGPSISFEVARNMPATVVAACEDETFAKEVQEIFATPTFRVYTSSDLVGVEFGGALKNIIAIAAGMSDGMGFGINTKAAILTRGIVEMSRLGVKMGARKETFFGLSGLGDLATTCMSEHSRNRWLGEEIGKGKKLKEILKETEMVVEGVTTTKSAYDLSKSEGVEMPITEKIYQALYNDKEPKLAVKELMTRTPKAEGI